MIGLKTDKNNLNMNTLIVETNEFLRDESRRKQIILESTMASFRLEGIDISEETALELSQKVNKDIKKYI